MGARGHLLPVNRDLPRAPLVLNGGSADLTNQRETISLTKTDQRAGMRALERAAEDGEHVLLTRPHSALARDATLRDECTAH